MKKTIFFLITLLVAGCDFLENERPQVDPPKPVSKGTKNGTSDTESGNLKYALTSLGRMGKNGVHWLKGVEMPSLPVSGQGTIERFIAEGLPKGLIINDKTGSISGTPLEKSKGHFTVSGLSGRRTVAQLKVPYEITQSEAIQLAAGAAHACAGVRFAFEDQSETECVVCWGDNRSGQLGGGEGKTPHDYPVLVQGLPYGKVEKLALGESHSCAVIDDNVYCWGGNSVGQLGIGRFSDGSGETPLQPVVMPSHHKVESISAKANHTCGVVDGAVYCWGLNKAGQLGRNARGACFNHVACSVAAVEVPGIRDVKEVSAGEGFTCARVGEKGVIQCWGDNSLGQLGPQESITGARLLSAGWASACALGEEQLYCWGRDLLQSSQHSSQVSALAMLSEPTSFSISSHHACFVLNERVYCWGANNGGQLTRFYEDLSEPTPVQFVPVLSVAAGGGEDSGTGFTCILAREKGARTAGVLCWGDNRVGQLGLGSEERNSPKAHSVGALPWVFPWQDGVN